MAYYKIETESEKIETKFAKTRTTKHCIGSESQNIFYSVS